MTSTSDRRGRPRSAGARGAAAACIGRLGYWLPVAIPLALFAQVALLGLRPALAERRHLAGMRAELEARRGADLELRDELALRYDARFDPIFRERQRRLALGPWSAR